LSTGRIRRLIASYS